MYMFVFQVSDWLLNIFSSPLLVIVLYPPLTYLLFNMLELTVWNADENIGSVQ